MGLRTITKISNFQEISYCFDQVPQRDVLKSWPTDSVTEARPPLTMSLSMMSEPHLVAAVNAVVAKDGVFLGCLNVLGSRGAYTQRSVLEAENLAAGLVDVLRELGRKTRE